MKKSVKELNAYVSCEKNGKYFNLKVEIPNGDETISLLVKPIQKDPQVLGRLLFKVYKTLEK